MHTVKEALARTKTMTRLWEKYPDTWRQESDKYEDGKKYAEQIGSPWSWADPESRREIDNRIEQKRKEEERERRDIEEVERARDEAIRNRLPRYDEVAQDAGSSRQGSTAGEAQRDPVDSFSRSGTERSNVYGGNSHDVSNQEAYIKFRVKIDSFFRLRHHPRIAVPRVYITPIDGRGGETRTD